MATRAQIAVIRDANAVIESQALGTLRDFWSTLPLDRPEVARDALLRFVPVLTEQYGEVAAVAAADWFDELRASERVPGRFRAVMAAPFLPEFVQQRVRYAARHLFTGTPEQMLGFLEGAVQKYVLQPGRDTIQRSAVADPQAAGWHRETRASESYASGCDFCRMLAGRGGVYKRATATFASHSDCHCVAVPSWDANAPEVPVEAYKASERAYRKSQEQLEYHRERTRRYLHGMRD